jgi:hypothetical protein
MSFARRPGDPAGATAVAEPAVNGYDDVAAKRIEGQLVELNGRLSEAEATIAWLEGALAEGPSAELLRRMKSLISIAEGDMYRLTTEARKQLRGE